jgi:hypothetical protein
VIPAFDTSADVNHDGYLNDAEYAHRHAGMDARFLYESRLFAGSYGQMRFATNPSAAGFRAWAADFVRRTLDANPLAQGVFLDNSAGVLPAVSGDVVESLASYTADFATMLNGVSLNVGPRWLLANTAGGKFTADAVVSRVQGYYEEFGIRALAHNWQQFEDLAGRVAERAALKSPAPYAVLDTLATGGSLTDARTLLASLAYYYLIADPNTTFLDLNGGDEPTSSWTRHWVQAAAYDVGQPVGGYSVLASGTDPANSALTYKVYEREYTNALVLYKPLSYAVNKTGTTANNTATTHALGGTYYVLRADGSRGPAVTSVTLRNGEGVVLIKA